MFSVDLLILRQYATFHYLTVIARIAATLEMQLSSSEFRALYPSLMRPNSRIFFACCLGPISCKKYTQLRWFPTTLITIIHPHSKSVASAAQLFFHAHVAQAFEPKIQPSLNPTKKPPTPLTPLLVIPVKR